MGICGSTGVINGAKWSEGYDDAKFGRSIRSSNKSYLKGYDRAVEDKKGGSK